MALSPSVCHLRGLQATATVARSLSSTSAPSHIPPLLLYDVATLPRRPRAGPPCSTRSSLSRRSGHTFASAVASLKKKQRLILQRKREKLLKAQRAAFAAEKAVKQRQKIDLSIQAKLKKRADEAAAALVDVQKQLHAEGLLDPRAFADEDQKPASAGNVAQDSTKQGQDSVKAQAGPSGSRSNASHSGNHEESPDIRAYAKDRAFTRWYEREQEKHTPAAEDAVPEGHQHWQYPEHVNEWYHRLQYTPREGVMPPRRFNFGARPPSRERQMWETAKVTYSQSRFEQAMEDSRLFKKPWGPFAWRIRSFWRRLFGITVHPPGSQPYMDETPGLWDSPWRFTQQPLPLLPTHNWPPKALTHRDAPDKRLSELANQPPHPLGAMYSDCTPRDLLVLAFGLQRYALPPTRYATRLENGLYEVIWKNVPINAVPNLTVEERAWVAENPNRLEYLGDTVAKTYAVRNVMCRFPDLSISGLIITTAHLTMNDTMAHMFDACELQQDRTALALQIYQEAIAKEKLHLLKTRDPNDDSFNPANIARETEHFEAPFLALGDKSDFFECYLAYIYMVFGNDAADKWFAQLLEPWMERLSQDTAFLARPKAMTDAGLIRRQAEREKSQSQSQSRIVEWFRSIKW